MQSLLPKRLRRTTVYESPFINLYTDRVEMPSGKIIEKYHILEYPRESIVAVVTDAADRICFVEARRYATQEVAWELPAGGIEEGETALDAAAREIREETGFTPETLEHKYTFNPSNGMSTQTMHVVFVQLATENQRVFDTDEVASVHWLSEKRARDMLARNDITDGVSVLALLMHLDKTK